MINRYVLNKCLGFFDKKMSYVEVTWTQLGHSDINQEEMTMAKRKSGEELSWIECMATNHEVGSSNLSERAI